MIATKHTRHSHPEGKHSSFKFQPPGCKWQKEIQGSNKIHQVIEIHTDIGKAKGQICGFEREKNDVK